MPNSPLLGIPQVASNQNNKETTINDAFSIIERSLNARLTVSLAADNVTLTSTEFQRSQVFHTTGALAIQTLTVPNQQRFFAVYNPGTYNVLVRSGTSSTVTVAPLSYVIMFAGGDNTLLKVADSAAAATSPTFLGQTDTPATFTGMAGYIPRVNVGETALEFFQLLLNMSNLQDVDAYTNGYYARVKTDGSGIEWVAANPGGETDFTNLNDTPANFTGSGLRLVRVNTGETALEFVDPAGLLSFLQLAGTPSSYSGQESKIVAVNASADGLEFVPFPSLGSYSTRAISNDNPGFELGYLTPWDMEASFGPAVTVVDEFNLVEANEGGFFVAVATTDFDDVTFAAIFDLTAAATNSELDNAATVTLPYAWVKLETGDTLGEVTLYAETASGTVLGSVNAAGLDGALDTWNTAAIQLALPTGTRRIRVTVRTYNGTTPDMTFGWDNLIPVLTVLEPLAFTALPDTPADYVGAANQFVRVNTGESSLEFVTLALTHVSGFPSSYAGHAGKIVVVNPGENGVIFTDMPSGLPDMEGHEGKVLAVASGEEEAEWIDPPASYPDLTGNAGRMLAANSSEDGVEWVDPPVIGGVAAAEMTLLRQSVSQTFGASTTTQIAFGVSDAARDAGGFWDSANPSQFTVPAGVSAVLVSLSWRRVSSPGASESESIIQVNGSTRAYARQSVGGWGGDTVTAILPVTAGDVITGHVWSTGSVATNPASTAFSIADLTKVLSAETDTAIELVSEAVALTLTQAHRNKIIEAPAALVITLPAEGTESIEVGSLYTVSNIGAGVVTITAASGVYLNSDLAGSVTVPDQWAGVTLYKRATNAWVVQGAFTAGA